MRVGVPEVGLYVHYHTMDCEPCDRWGRIVNVNYPRWDTFSVEMLDDGTSKFTENDYPSEHLTLYREPPDAFFVWQAKYALLSGLTSASN